ncbi:hypothetical protein E2562_033419 [Oryza meyeriana var. granulata]|uniref:Uncharacterized protein n=1 Tax=Oryza meyeriana var. granulata TaxID=110450 RepID=A0A6G1CV48_9ORYZ|nr:hypothetical protein E2562_033419 [Oryza meyeriana var. granulata]
MADRSRADAMALCSGIIDNKPPHTEGNLTPNRTNVRGEGEGSNEGARLGPEESYLWREEARHEEAARRGEEGAPELVARLRRREAETARAKTLDRRTTGEAAITS